MFFITNRTIEEEPLSSEQLAKKKSPRPIKFKMDDNQAGHSFYFCERKKKDHYVEIGSSKAMELIRKMSKVKNILLYIHGFNNMPEKHIFPRAAQLHKFFNPGRSTSVFVVPVIWPCDNDLGVIKDYWDDQKSADQSSFAFARVLETFFQWREEQAEKCHNDPTNKDVMCDIRINVLAHSMGNRVFRETIVNWAKYDRGGNVPLLFRNVFLVAADVVNETLERGRPGNLITQSARNVSVYYASDDLALRASKVSNLKNKVASRRLGHSGPENLELIPRNVYSIDCDGYNTKYDKPAGHTYFLDNGTGKKNKPGVVFKHIQQSIDTGRVEVSNPETRTHVFEKTK